MLFPASIPTHTQTLQVSDLHRLHLEEYGNPNGVPVVFVHGGPGGGFGESDHRFFDPNFYRIILFDQRGSGKSTPHAELQDNTTQTLVSDMEKIREHLGIQKWLLFGGSWGSTLSLAYAEEHPERVSGLILRGIFLLRPKEIQWFYQDGINGAGRFFPEEWKKFEAHIPPEERHDMVAAYYRRLTSPDEATRYAAAKLWSGYEGATSKLVPSQASIDHYEALDVAVAMARIECHYFMNNGFLGENQLLANVDKIRAHHIPTWIVQGRYDMVCPRDSADDLHKAFPEATYWVVDDAGHARSEPGIADALVRATEAFKDRVAAMA